MATAGQTSACLLFLKVMDEGWTFCYETFWPFKFAKVGPSNLGQKLGTTNDFPSVHCANTVNSPRQLTRVARGPKIRSLCFWTSGPGGGFI